MLPLEKHLRVAIPRVALGRFPTPVESHEALARELGFTGLAIKREDMSALDGPGGNKLRALEWILPEAGSWIVSMGGYGSTYVAALSFYAQRHGRKVAVGLFPQPWLGSVPGTLAATESRAQVFLADAKWKLPFAVVRAWRHASRYGRPTWVPAGGANPLGVLGGVNAALEFWDQVNRGEAARPDVIVAPLGSGATVAGLLLGSWIAESDVTICGVRVADPIVANRWQVARLVSGTRRLLKNRGLDVRRGHARLRVLTGLSGRWIWCLYLRRSGGGATPFGPQSRRGGDIRRQDLRGARRLARFLPAPGFWNTFDPQIADCPRDTPLLRRARTTRSLCGPTDVDLTVYPDECDAFGHLNQASFLSLFERARWEMMARGPGMDFFTVASMARGAKGRRRIPRAGLPGRRHPLSATLLHLGRTSFTLRQTARRVLGDVLLATAELSSFAWIARDVRCRSVGFDRFMNQRSPDGSLRRSP